MPKRRVTEVIEVAAFAMLTVLVVLWAGTQNGGYEPWTAICGVVAVGLDLYRRYCLKDEADSKAPQEDTAQSLLS